MQDLKQAEVLAVRLAVRDRETKKVVWDEGLGYVVVDTDEADRHYFPGDIRAAFDERGRKVEID